MIVTTATIGIATIGIATIDGGTTGTIGGTIERWSADDDDTTTTIERL